MLTDVYLHAHGLTENDGRFGGRAGLEPDNWLLHQSLKKAGYRCAWFGKWHVDNARSAVEYGLEGYSLPGYGYPYRSDEYTDYLKRYKLPSPVACIEMPGKSDLSVDTEVSLTKVDNWFDYEAGSATLNTPAETHESYFLAQHAIDWLDTVSDEPFFMRVDTWGPHPPYLVAAPFAGSISPYGIELPENIRHDLQSRPLHHRDHRDYWQSTLKLDEAGWRQMAAR